MDLSMKSKLIALSVLITPKDKERNPVEKNKSDQTYVLETRICKVLKVMNECSLLQKIADYGEYKHCKWNRDCLISPGVEPIKHPRTD